MAQKGCDFRHFADEATVIDDVACSALAKDNLQYQFVGRIIGLPPFASTAGGALRDGQETQRIRTGTVAADAVLNGF